ncbi:MAG TPA: hypothetical protein DCP90_01830 [Clostridiales bacterium]|nr:MAG: hypothetical protein A2Y22_03360 [Clostridiales bacterium GWD2_32_59]HAN09333.1 hypothetical protein [Clostridiales bacterium]
MALIYTDRGSSSVKIVNTKGNYVDLVNVENQVCGLGLSDTNLDERVDIDVKDIAEGIEYHIQQKDNQYQLESTQPHLRDSRQNLVVATDYDGKITKSELSVDSEKGKAKIQTDPNGIIYFGNHGTNTCRYSMKNYEDGSRFEKLFAKTGIGENQKSMLFTVDSKSDGTVVETRVVEHKGQHYKVEATYNKNNPDQIRCDIDIGTKTGAVLGTISSADSELKSDIPVEQIGKIGSMIDQINGVGIEGAAESEWSYANGTLFNIQQNVGDLVFNPNDICKVAETDRLTSMDMIRGMADTLAFGEFEQKNEMTPFGYSKKEVKETKKQIVENVQEQEEENEYEMGM